MNGHTFSSSALPMPLACAVKTMHSTTNETFNYKNKIRFVQIDFSLKFSLNINTIFVHKFILVFVSQEFFCFNGLPKICPFPMYFEDLFTQTDHIEMNLMWPAPIYMKAQ